MGGWYFIWGLTYNAIINANSILDFSYSENYQKLEKMWYLSLGVFLVSLKNDHLQLYPFCWESLDFILFMNVSSILLVHIYHF